MRPTCQSAAYKASAVAPKITKAAERSRRSIRCASVAGQSRRVCDSRSEALFKYRPLLLIHNDLRKKNFLSLRGRCFLEKRILRVGITLRRVQSGVQPDQASKEEGCCSKNQKCFTHAIISSLAPKSLFLVSPIPLIATIDASVCALVSAEPENLDL